MLMRHISLLLPEQVNVAGFDNPRQGLAATNALLLAKGKSAAFSVEVVGIRKKVNADSGYFSIHADKTIDEVKRTDVVIIPPIQGDIHTALQHNRALYPWITQQRKNGAQIVSLCLGAFLLAQTGLLDGKSCVTHWMARSNFQQLFPKVTLVSDKIITDEDGICTGGGAFSSANLMLHIIEKWVDRETAIHCSKIFQIDADRVSQSPFIIFNKQRDHGDEQILKAQKYIETRFHSELNVSQLSDMVALGRRTFERRFKKATSNTPIEYIQRIRMEAAKKALEKNLKTVNQIMYDVGYSDPTAFRSVFKKTAGVTPLEYRKKFTRRPIIAKA